MIVNKTKETFYARKLVYTFNGNNSKQKLEFFRLVWDE